MFLLVLAVMCAGDQSDLDLGRPSPDIRLPAYPPAPRPPFLARVRGAQKGLALLPSLKPGMTEGQVWALLGGPGDSCYGGIGSWCVIYERYRLSVTYRRPIISPQPPQAPEPDVVTDVQWCGFDW